MLQDKILWPELLAPQEPYPMLTDVRRADVCIIGAGYTGLSAGIHLAEQGQRVAVLEAHRTGAGGSGRNVGLVNAGTWAQPDELKRLLGESVGEKLTEALGAAPRLVFDLIDRYGIDAQDTRSGNLHMAHNAKGEADIASRYAQLRRRGADVEMLEGARCREYCGTDAVGKALLDKRAGTVNPYAYVCGMAAALAGLGGMVFEQSAVTAIERDGNGQWLVKTAAGGICADKVVIAGNAYTEGEWTELLKTIYFVCYYQIASEPLSGSAAARILPYGNGSWDTRLALSSIRRDREGRLLLGTVGLSEGREALYLKWAQTMCRHYFPDLGAVSWQYRWCGRFGFTADHILRLFEPMPGIVAATAYNGRGITTGTLVGKAFADYLLHDRPDALPLPLRKMEECFIPGRTLRSACYDAGLALYHAGQCLRIVA